MKLVEVPIEQYTFFDGSMNARQYHAWLWAQVPKDLPDAKLLHISKVINGLTEAFMFGGLFDDPTPGAEKGGLTEWLAKQDRKRQRRV